MERHNLIRLFNPHIHLIFQNYPNWGSHFWTDGDMGPRDDRSEAELPENHAANELEFPKELEDAIAALCNWEIYVSNSHFRGSSLVQGIFWLKPLIQVCLNINFDTKCVQVLLSKLRQKFPVEQLHFRKTTCYKVLSLALHPDRRHHATDVWGGEPLSGTQTEFFDVLIKRLNNIGFDKKAQ